MESREACRTAANKVPTAVVVERTGASTAVSNSHCRLLVEVSSAAVAVAAGIHRQHSELAVVATEHTLVVVAEHNLVAERMPVAAERMPVAAAAVEHRLAAAEAVHIPAAAEAVHIPAAAEVARRPAAAAVHIPAAGVEHTPVAAAAVVHILVVVVVVEG